MLLSNCQDNELSWFDWSLPEKHFDIYRFVKHLIHARLQRDISKPEYSMSLNQLLQKRSETWHSVNLDQPDWSHQSHRIAFTIQSLSGDIMTHYMLNAYHVAPEFELPKIKDALHWKRWIDTALESPDDICYQSDASNYCKRKIFGSAAFDSGSYCKFIIIQRSLNNELSIVFNSPPSRIVNA